MNGAILEQYNEFMRTIEELNKLKMSYYKLVSKCPNNNVFDIIMIHIERLEIAERDLRKNIKDIIDNPTPYSADNMAHFISLCVYNMGLSLKTFEGILSRL